MRQCRTRSWKGLQVLTFPVVMLALAGCASIEPYQPRNQREEGPEKGVFTGSQGEFVILKRGDEERGRDCGAPVDSGDTEGSARSKEVGD